MNSFHLLLIVSGFSLTGLFSPDSSDREDNGFVQLQSGFALSQNPASSPLIKEAEPEMHVTIAPNPNAGYFVVLLPENLMKQNGKIEIYNLSGKKVYSTDFARQVTNKIDIDISNHASGTYFIVIVTDQERIMNKFQKS